jgi:hypothetical protein
MFVEADRIEADTNDTHKMSSLTWTQLNPAGRGAFCLVQYRLSLLGGGVPALALAKQFATYCSFSGWVRMGDRSTARQQASLVA